jgi:hypothetical protein
VRRSEAISDEMMMSENRETGLSRSTMVQP